jgi:hypothetical protein
MARGEIRGQARGALREQNGFHLSFHSRLRTRIEETPTHRSHVAMRWFLDGFAREK